MWETTVMHKQVSGWTVNFGPIFPESPFLELKTRKPPPHFGKLQIWDDQSLLRNTPPISENFRFGMTKVYSGIPSHFGKLQIWDDQSLLRNTPPKKFWKLQIWDDQSLLRNTPPKKNSENFRFGMTKVYSGIPPPPNFGKLQIWDDQSLLWNTLPKWKLSESPSLRFSEYRELLHVETLSNPDNY